MTLEDLRRAAALMKKYEVKPGVIKTPEEAAEATRQTKAIADLGGIDAYEWKVGDEYYLVHAWIER